jgi:hypothetical protein
MGELSSQRQAPIRAKTAAFIFHALHDRSFHDFTHSKRRLLDPIANESLRYVCQL